eukprot:m.259427 g.259427  ORF g.259427 m.259427 type:complete len:71 (-) comp26772_c1_seq21:409-621(-)
MLSAFNLLTLTPLALLKHANKQFSFLLLCDINLNTVSFVHSCLYCCGVIIATPSFPGKAGNNDFYGHEVQ